MQEVFAHVINTTHAGNLLHVPSIICTHVNAYGNKPYSEIGGCTSISDAKWESEFTK